MAEVTRARRILLALLLLGGGGSLVAVQNYLVTNTGATVVQAREAVKTAVERRNTVERVLVAVPLAQLAAAGANVAPIICGPDTDAGPAWDDCIAANGTDTFSERYCRKSDGVEVARGGELAVTAEMRDRFLADRDPGISYTFVRGASIDKPAELDSRGLQRCADPEP